MGTCTDNCVFCDIIRENDKNKITFEDELVVIFPDIKPASSSHYLVVPKIHILDVKQLNPSHLNLLQHMISVGKNVLEDKNCETSEMRFGFHWPPFRTVPHLHLHAIAPISQMNFLSRMIFKENSWWFVTPEYVVSRLEGMKTDKQCL
uniref:Adenosine 5'-monophosphoramidase HINT3 n=1 Tax=Panstrongylus megistus TaxID=65343 RepID=A0A069DNX0_9HEMI